MNISQQLEEMLPLAEKELKAKDFSQIHFESAMTWAARAVVAFKMSMSMPTAATALLQYDDARCYESKAMESATLLVGPDFTSELTDVLFKAREAAFRSLVGAEDEPKKEVDLSTESTSEAKDFGSTVSDIVDETEPMSSELEPTTKENPDAQK